MIPLVRNKESAAVATEGHAFHRVETRGRAHCGTFDTTRYDGRGRVVEVTRALGDDAGVWQVAYDGLGNVASVTDPAGNRKVQAWDLAGRALESLEHGADQRRAVNRLLEAQRYYDIRCYQDLAGLDRVTECRFVE